MRRLRARPERTVLSVVAHTVTAVPTHAGVTDLLVDVLRTLDDAIVTVTEDGVVIARLPGDVTFYVTTAR